jgi:hypothetical protein
MVVCETPTSVRSSQIKRWLSSWRPTTPPTPRSSPRADVLCREGLCKRCKIGLHSLKVFLSVGVQRGVNVLKAKQFLEMDAAKTDFLTAGYQELRAEIRDSINAIESAQRDALIFSGAIWAWLATQSWKPHFQFILLLPLCVSFFYWYKHLQISRTITNIAIYLKKVEEQIVPEGLGWETYVARAGHKHFKYWNIFYWSALISFNFIIGAYLFMYIRVQI